MAYRITYHNKQYEFNSVGECADVLHLNYAIAWNVIFIKNEYIEKVIPADVRSHRKTEQYDYSFEAPLDYDVESPNIPSRPKISIKDDWTQPYNILYVDGSEQQLHLCHMHLRLIIDMEDVINTTPVFGHEKQSCQWCDKLSG